MKIDQVILKGFRQYKEATINSNNNTLIIGENDIGKTKMARRHEQWVVGYPPLKLLAMKKQNGYRTLNDLAFLFLKINELVPFLFIIK